MRTLRWILLTIAAILIALGFYLIWPQVEEFHDRQFSSAVDEVGELIISANQEFVANELDWLTKAVYFEARGESQLGQTMVAQAVMGRVADDRWPNTVEAVVRQGEDKGKHRCQFSFMCDGLSEQVDDLAAWLKAYEVAKVVYDFYERGQLDTSVHSYHATYAKRTGYFKSLALAGQEGLHLFYTDH